MDLQSCGPPLASGSTCSEAVEPVRKPGVIVLAGGESRRMGMEKGLVPFQGKPMVAHVLAAAAAWDEHILIVANDPAYRQFGYPVVPDEQQGQGPVAGIITGLKHSHHEQNLVVSCDIPNIHPDVLALLAAKAEGNKVVILQAQGRIHPLIGIYSKACLPHFEACLGSGERKLRNVIAAMSPLVLDLDQEMPGYDPAWLENFNTMEAVMAASVHKT